MPYVECALPKYPCQADMWDELQNIKKPIVVYGMGNGADKLIARFAKYGIEIADFFASDGFVRGHFFHGKRVKSFSEIKEEYSDFVIVLSFASARAEVLDMLSKINDEYDLVIPDMPVADETEYFDRAFYNDNYENILQAYNSLVDAESKNAFASILNYKLTGRMKYLLGAYSEKEELYALLNRICIENYVDAGAYNGDTLREAEKYFPSLKRALAIEPDPKNFKKLTKYTDTVENIDVTALNAAVWCECADGEFASSGNRNSSVNATPSYEHKSASVPLVCLDSVIDWRVDFIKYDVEGAEYEALLGTNSVIEKDKPTLLVSLYHRSRDIFFIINYLYSRYGEYYDFYIRRLLCVPAWEIDLILIRKIKT